MVADPPGGLNGDVPTNLPVPSRPRDGAMLGGVCAGLARRWQLDPNLLRITVVVLSVFGGLGLVGYGCGLLLMPREGQAELPVRRILPFTRNWSTAAVVAATIASAVVLLALTGFNGVGLGPVVVVFLIWFFGFRGRGSRVPAPPPEPTPFERAAEGWRERLVEQRTPGYEAQAIAAPAASATSTASAAQPLWEQPYTNPAADRALSDHDLVVPAVRPRRRWTLWWLALALVGAGVLTVSLLGRVGLPATPLAYAAAVLTGLGLTLLVATRSGRPPLLLPATLAGGLATAVLLAGTGVPAPRVGEITQAFTAADELPDAVELTAGEIDLDLSRVQLLTDRTLTVQVGAGSVRLVLPDDQPTLVDWTVKAGAVAPGDGTSQDGLHLAGSTGLPATEPGAATLRIRVVVDLGELEVVR